MTTGNPQLTRLRQHLARIATTPGTTLYERAEAALTVLGQVLPFDAAWLAVRDPELGRHTPLAPPCPPARAPELGRPPPRAPAGTAEPLRRYFQTPEADAEVEQLGLNRHR